VVAREPRTGRHVRRSPRIGKASEGTNEADVRRFQGVLWQRVLAVSCLLSIGARNGVAHTTAPGLRRRARGLAPAERQYDTRARCRRGLFLLFAANPGESLAQVRVDTLCVTE